MNMTDLLKDPVYRRYFLTVPRLPYDLAIECPWRVWVLKDGKWLKRDFATFEDSFKFVKPRFRTWEDVSISSRVIGFDPPKNVRHAFNSYDWCKRCRRPSVFKTFKTHHALDNSIHRFFSHIPVCRYCGASEGTSLTVVKEVIRDAS